MSSLHTLSRARRYGITDQGAAFTPRQLSPRAWWNWDYLTQGVDSVYGNYITGAWSDASGNGHYWYQSNGSLDPTLTFNYLNGRPVLYFPGGKYLENSTGVLSGLTSGEIFFVLKCLNDPGSGNPGAWSLGNGDGISSHYPWSDGNIYDETLSSARKTVGNPTPALTNWHIYSVASSSSEWTARLNGSVLYTTGTNTVDTTETPRLGGSYSTTYTFAGWMAEIILIPYVLSADQRTATLSYLRTKFAI